MSGHIAVLARAPSSGGKTRLTSGLSPERALSLRTALLADTLAVVHATGIPCTVFFTPAENRDEMARVAGPRAALVPQQAGDLGARMGAALAWLFRAGGGPVVLIGSDLPSLPVARITRAFERLAEGDEVVLGPAEDGGYYLIGLSRPVPALFAGMRWGGADVFASTRDRAAAAGLRVGMVEPWYDVDQASDLGRVPRGDEPARHTRAWVGMNDGSGG